MVDSTEVVEDESIHITVKNNTFTSAGEEDTQNLIIHILKKQKGNSTIKCTNKSLPTQLIIIIIMQKLVCLWNNCKFKTFSQLHN